MYVLYVHYSGYCLFKVKEFEEIGHLIQSVRSSMNDIKKFMAIIKLKAFYAFHSVIEANENIVNIRDNKIPFSMRKFIDKFNSEKIRNLGFEFLNLSEQFKEQFDLNIIKHVGITEIIRSIKFHISKILKNHQELNNEKKFLKSLSHKIIEKKNVGLSFGVNVTNSYNLIVDLEKNLNIKIVNLKAAVKPFFPELINLDNKDDLFLPRFLSSYFSGEDSTVNNIDENLDNDLIKLCKESINNTIGKEICISHKQLIKDLCDDILKFVADIKECKMMTCKITKNSAPNLSALLQGSIKSGSSSNEIETSELIASKLIATAGSLKKLSELPSTTIHTLTFKDSLLRKGNFNHLPRKEEDTLRSKQSKLLSNKAALASRVDYFSTKTSETNQENYGESLHEIVSNKLISWADKKGIQIHQGDKIETENRIKKMKLKRKEKKKQWMKKKKVFQSMHSKIEVDLET